MSLLRFLRNGGPTVGIDVSARSIRAARVEHRAGALVLAGWLRLERPAGCAPGTPGEEEAEALAAAMRRRGMGGCRAVLAVNPADQVTTMVQLPPAGPGVPLDDIARAQVADAARCDGAELEVAWWPSHLRPSVAGGASPGNGGGTTAAVGVGVRRERVLELVDRFEGAGIEVAAVDLRSAALLRACAATGAGGGGGGPWQADGALRTILDLGWGNAAMVLARHGLPVYERTLPELGLGTLVGQVAQALRVDAAAAEFVVMRVGLDEAAPVAKGLNPVRLAEARELIRAHHAAVGEELRTAREYAAAGPDDPVLVAGATASPGLAAGIAAAAHAKVSVFSPAWCKGRAGATELERPDPGALAVALGLALHPVWAGGRDAGEGRAAA